MARKHRPAPQRADAARPNRAAPPPGAPAPWRPEPVVPGPDEPLAALRVGERVAAWATMLAQFALAAVAFRFAATLRLMDADEGHFLSAIRAVYEGLKPCQDFFYQQTPLFPYPYALAMKLFGYGYEPCLWVSVLCGAGLAAVTAAYFRDRCRSLTASWFGWLLIMLNAQVLFWTPTVKNHALPLFAGALALWAASRHARNGMNAFAWGMISGFAAVWAVGSRLPAAPLAAAAGAWLLLRAVSPGRPRGAAWGLAGFVVGAVPPVLLILRSVYPDVDVFKFDVFEFHRIRSGARGTWGDWNTISAELTVLGLQGQWPAMLIAAIAGGVWGAARLARRAAASHAGAIVDRPGGVELGLALAGVGAAVLSLLPQQTFHQYFMVPLVLFVFAVAPLAGAARWARRWEVWRPAAVGALAAYGVFVTNHREKVFPDFPASWGRAKVEALSKALAEHTAPDDEIFSTWGGFNFFARRREIPGNENFNARTIVNKVPAEMRPRLKIISDEELLEKLERGEPAALVIGFFAGAWREGFFYRRTLYVGRPDPTKPTRTLLSPRMEIFQHYERVPLEDQGTHELWVRKKQ